MPLPSISLPTFKAVIPSTGKEISYRPFLVKEEKILLMALEGKDKKEIRIAIEEILKSCILDEVEVGKLPTFDIEYLFLMLRAKSVGEVVTFKLGHGEGSECKHKTEIAVDLNEIEVQGKISDGKIMITDKIGVVMHYPTISITELIDGGVTHTFNIIADCIDVVFDENEVYEDFTTDEIIDWLGNLDKHQFSKITDFFADIPKLKHKIEWICEKCGEKDSVEIEGLYNFFT
jgi:hypothetical protein